MTPAARTVRGVTKIQTSKGHQVSHPVEEFFFLRLLVVMAGLMVLSISSGVVERRGRRGKTSVG